MQHQTLSLHNESLSNLKKKKKSFGAQAIMIIKIKEVDQLD